MASGKIGPVLLSQQKNQNINQIKKKNEIKNKVTLKGKNIEYTIKNINKSKTLYFESAGILSESFEIEFNALRKITFLGIFRMKAKKMTQTLCFFCEKILQ